MSFQVSGLASGLDTAALIDGLMFAEEATVRRLQRSMDTENEALDAWSDIQTRLNTVASAVTAIRDGDALEAATVSSNDETLVQASVNGSALSGV